MIHRIVSILSATLIWTACDNHEHSDAEVVGGQRMAYTDAMESASDRRGVVGVGNINDDFGERSAGPRATAESRRTTMNRTPNAGPLNGEDPGPPSAGTPSMSDDRASAASNDESFYAAPSGGETDDNRGDEAMDAGSDGQDEMPDPTAGFAAMTGGMGSNGSMEAQSQTPHYAVDLREACVSECQKDIDCNGADATYNDVEDCRMDACSFLVGVSESAAALNCVRRFIGYYQCLTDLTCDMYNVYWSGEEVIDYPCFDDEMAAHVACVEFGDGPLEE